MSRSKRFVRGSTRKLMSNEKDLERLLDDLLKAEPMPALDAARRAKVFDEAKKSDQRRRVWLWLPVTAMAVLVALPFLLVHKDSRLAVTRTRVAQIQRALESFQLSH